MSHVTSKIAALALLAALGCAGGSDPQTAPSAVADSAAARADEGATAAARRSDVIGTAELRDVDAANLYEAVLQLRPRFVRQRGMASVNLNKGNEIVVYIDNNRAGGVAVLQEMHPSEAAEVRYLDGPQASARFGMNHGSGAILVTRKRGR